MSNNFNNLLKDKNDIGYGTLIVTCIIIIGVAFGLSCLYAWIGMLLWNWIMPMLWTCAIEMSFWPMWGLIELCRILFRPVRWSTNNNNE